MAASCPIDRARLSPVIFFFSFPFYRTANYVTNTFLSISEHHHPCRFNKRYINVVLSLPKQYRALAFLNRHTETYTTYINGSFNHSTLKELPTEVQGLFEELPWLDIVKYYNAQVEIWRKIGRHPPGFDEAMTSFDDIIAQIQGKCGKPKPPQKV